MRNQGQITVFLSLILVSLLILFLAAIGAVGFYMDRARVSEAAKGASEHIKADYQGQIFEEYHVLLLDKTYAGRGEGALEDRMLRYLDYTLSSYGFQIQDVSLTGMESVMDSHCALLREQIRDYMTLYLQVKAVKDVGEWMQLDDSSAESMAQEIATGKMEESERSGDWKGEDPRKVLQKEMKHGLLDLVLPENSGVSGVKIDMSDLPSHTGQQDSDGGHKNSGDGQKYSDGEDDCSVDTSFEDIDRLEADMKKMTRSGLSESEQSVNGESKQASGLSESGEAGSGLSEMTDAGKELLYGLTCFDYFTRTDGKGHPLHCEVEYLIAGRDNDYDNLQAVINRIVLHRMPVNMAVLLTDPEKMAEIDSIALTLSLAPGITYGAAKYLLAACLSYAETLVEIRSLLAGHKIPLVKTGAEWIVDFDSIGKLTELDQINYTGADGVDYRAFLFLLLAEKGDVIYERMCDVMQMVVREKQPEFLMKDCICVYTADLDIRKHGRNFSIAIEASYQGQR